MQRHLCVPLILLCLGLISPGTTRGFVVEGKEPEQLYQEALAIRQDRQATWKQQQEAVDLLLHAAGFGAQPNPPTKELSYVQHLGKRLGPQLLLLYLPSSASELPPGGLGVEVPAPSHPGALRELAKVFRDGYAVDPHQQLSCALFVRAAELGDPEAQGQMGLRYSLGLHDPAVWDREGILRFEEPDEELALLHYYFAASNGDNYARMVLGYRHMHGVGVPKSCWTAAAYYQPVAEQVADLAMQPNTFPFVERIRLHVQSNHGLKTDRQREVLQYYQYSADKGNVDAQTAVGQVLNYGTHGVQRDHAQALHYLQKAADAGDHDAMAHLGHMFANGFGTQKDMVTARTWLQKAADHESASGQYGLGYMYLTGTGGVEEDADKAFKLFTQAANQGNADASFCLGIMHQKGLSVRRKNAQKAFHYFSMAAHAGHLLAMYNAAMMQLAGKGTVKTCKPALTFLKQMSERGPNAAALQLGHEHFFRSEYSQSLLHYLEAAEMGMELGQSNAAWLMHRAYVSPGGRRANVTFSLVRQSAEQGNVASLLMMADSYLHGEGVEQDWVRSAAVYYDAYQERSAQAMFNLGFAHEFGMGVPQDLPLARRFYQMAKHTQKDAAVAVHIACAWLTAHQIWEAVTPWVPSPLQSFWRRALTIERPYTTLLGRWGVALKAALPTHALLQAEAGASRLARLLRLPDVLSYFSEGFGEGEGDAGGDEGDDLSDTTLLIGLVVVLIVVLRARQQRAAARAGGGGAAGPGDVVVAQPGQGANGAAGVPGLEGDGPQQQHGQGLQQQQAQQQQHLHQRRPGPEEEQQAAGQEDERNHR